MYNQEILDQIMKKFGLQDTIRFCEMESFKNKLLYEDCVSKGDCEPIEYEFEQDWWWKQATRLKLNNI